MEGTDVIRPEPGPGSGPVPKGGPLSGRSGRWNSLRFDPKSPRPHVESYFFKLNDPKERRAVWIKATVFAPKANPDRAVAEAWAVAFDRDKGQVASKDTVPFAHSVFPTDTFRISVADLEVAESRIRGAVAGAGHEIAFDLEASGRTDPLVPFFHPLMYELPFPRTKLVTPNPVLYFNGRYSVDGEEVEVSQWCGMQGHNWGGEHAPSYAWCQCNEWREAGDLVLEAFTARVRLGSRLSPPLTIICIRYRGELHLFNGPIDMLLNRAAIGPLRYRFECSNPQLRVKGELGAEPGHFAGLYYRNPDGSVIHCLNSKITEATVELRARGERAAVLTSGRAALEVGTRDATHGVRMYI
jgi:hypothetical protein